MQHANERGPHLIIEISEMFQELLKYAAADGIVEAWCLEITLKKGFQEETKETDVEAKNQMIGLHSLFFYILKKLEKKHHEILSEHCGCGWDVSSVPKLYHSDVYRYTPGTIIRWSMGECHVLFASSPTISNSYTKVVDRLRCTENQQLSDPVTSEITETAMNEEDFDLKVDTIQDVNSPNSQVTRNEEYSKTGSNIPEISKDSQHFIKYQHFCDENVKCTEYELASKENSEQNIALHCLPLTKNVVGNVRNQVQNSSVDADDNDEVDEENSCMLIINEDENSQDLKESRNGHKRANSLERNDECVKEQSFHRALPNDSEKVEEKKESLTNSCVFKDTDPNNDDTYSICSSSSSSSSSSSTSSSTSSEDDDRINFEKRVEEAAQAARDAAESATMSTFASQDNASTVEREINLLPSTSQDFLITSSFETLRNFDDIQAAQGLAALGKSHEHVSTSCNKKENGLFSNGSGFGKETTSSIAQKLLQGRKIDVKRLGPKEFQCGVCRRIFCRLTKALEHHVSHSGEKPWACQVCGKKYAKYHSLQKHEKVEHASPESKKFSCCICLKTFALQSILNRHLVTHKVHKPFLCRVCGRSFALKFTRDTHEALHSGNRPWICSICGKAFISKYKLNSHMKGHTGELFCRACNRTFRSQDAFSRHKKRHHKSSDPIVSSFPPRTLNYSSSDAQFVNEKSSQIEITLDTSSAFRCQMCNKIFQKSSDLTLHLTSCNAINFCHSNNVLTTSEGQTISCPNTEIQHLVTHSQGSMQQQPLIAYTSEKEKSQSCSAGNNMAESEEGNVLEFII